MFAADPQCQQHSAVIAELVDDERRHALPAFKALIEAVHQATTTETITPPIIAAFDRMYALPTEVLAERETLFQSFPTAKEQADRIAACVARQKHVEYEFLFYSRTLRGTEAASRYDAATVLAAALNNTILAISNAKTAQVLNLPTDATWPEIGRALTKVDEIIRLQRTAEAQLTEFVAAAENCLGAWSTGGLNDSNIRVWVEITLKDSFIESLKKPVKKSGWAFLFGSPRVDPKTARDTYDKRSMAAYSAARNALDSCPEKLADFLGTILNFRLGKPGDEFSAAIAQITTQKIECGRLAGTLSDLRRAHRFQLQGVAA